MPDRARAEARGWRSVGGMRRYPKVPPMLLSESPPDSPPAATAEALRWEGEGLSKSEPDI